MPSSHGKIVPGSLLLTNGKICPQVHAHRVHENEKGIFLFPGADLTFTETNYSGSPPFRTRLPSLPREECGFYHQTNQSDLTGSSAYSTSPPTELAERQSSFILSVYKRLKNHTFFIARWAAWGGGGGSDWSQPHPLFHDVSPRPEFKGVSHPPFSWRQWKKGLSFFHHEH